VIVPFMVCFGVEVCFASERLSVLQFLPIPF